MKDKIIVVGLLGLLLIGVGVYLFLTSSKVNNSASSNNSKINVSTQIESINWDSYDSNEITLTKSIKITKEGTYTLSGTILDGLIYINTNGKVKLILNGVSITNSSGPAIYIENADTVEIKTVKGTINSLEDGKVYSGYDDVEGVIYSKDDLVLSGEGTLKIVANLGDAIVSKDDLKITSGIYNITASDDAIKGKDSVEIIDGEFIINSKGDGIKSTNDKDSSKGFILISGGKFEINSSTDGLDAETNIYITGGNLNINAGDDGIHANGLLQIDGGTLDITAAEGLEATYVKINGGTINISASDDGINAANKSSSYSVTVEINGGDITIKMGQGDTDGIDSNGNLYINGGTINITGQSPFDYDNEAKYTGGTMIINGEKTTNITNQFGGQMRGNMGEVRNNGGNPNGGERPNDMRGERKRSGV